jgi:nitroreductase
MEQLHGVLSKGNEWAQAASMIIAVVSRPDLDCQIKGREYYQFDTGMATAALILRATELGLVAHPIAGFSPNKTRPILNIPETMDVIALVIVGKKADTIDPRLSDTQVKAEQTRPERKPLSQIAFHNTYPLEQEGMTEKQT